MSSTKTNKKYKRSRQRERMLELLRDCDTHPTADWVYNKLKAEFPNLSMGTVYRNLAILGEQNLVSKIDFGSTYDRYDGRTDAHYHFICEECGAVMDAPLPVDSELNARLAARTDYTVHRHRIEFYGVCDACAQGGTAR